MERSDCAPWVGFWENWTNCIDRSCDGAAFRMRARRMGIDAAIMLTAGSAIPKTLMSTVVALCLVRANGTEGGKGR